MGGMVVVDFCMKVPCQLPSAERRPANVVQLWLDLFETPVTVTPQQRNFKNFTFFKTSLKILDVYFWGKNVYFWGTNVYFWGTNVYFWDNQGFRVFWNFFLDASFLLTVEVFLLMVCLFCLRWGNRN